MENGCTKPCPCTTNTTFFQIDGYYNSRDLYKTGRYVVGLRFTNMGDAAIQFVQKFTLQSKESYTVLIPSGFANVNEWQYIFLGGNAVTKSLQVDEVIAQDPALYE